MPTGSTSLKTRDRASSIWSGGSGEAPKPRALGVAANAQSEDGNGRTPESRALEAYHERAIGISEPRALGTHHVRVVRSGERDLGAESARYLLRAHSPRRSGYLSGSKVLDIYREHVAQRETGISGALGIYCVHTARGDWRDIRIENTRCVP